MKISKNIKILIGVLVIIIMAIIAVSGWLIFKGEEKKIEKRVEIKGELETIQLTPFSVFNKECLDGDLKVGNYYLTGLCKKPYLAASLLEAIGEEIEIKGETKEMKVDMPSEEDPEILITKTFKVIEIEEIVPPEIIRIITNTTVYEPGEKITLHLKHYLKKSVFSYFNTEKPACAIESIEKKNGDWQELTTWSQDTDCSQINLKETKPYHLSGEFGMFEWQSNLELGEYRLKIIYKLEGEEDWKEVYSNEFVIAKPITHPSRPVLDKCEVSQGKYPYKINYEEERYPKVLSAEIEWKDYNKFSLNKISIEYGYAPKLWLIHGGPLSLKVGSKNEDELNFAMYDPREIVIFCEWCPDCPPCPPPQSLKEGEFNLRISFGGTRDISFVEIYEREKPPAWADFPNHRPKELLLRIEVVECFKKFCDEIAITDDPGCRGEYYFPPTMIKGKVTDHQGKPIEKVSVYVYWTPFGEPITYKSTIIGMFQTDKEGAYSVERLSEGYPNESRLIEGTYSLSFNPHSWFAPNLKPVLDQRIDLQKGETKTLDIAFGQRGSIGGKITDKEGNPITDALVYEIGFETPRYAVCEEARKKEGICELGQFIIPFLEPGNYQVGACVKTEDKCIELSPQKVKVELGKTAIVNFVFEK